MAHILGRTQRSFPTSEASQTGNLSDTVPQERLMRSFCSPELSSFRYLLISDSWKQEGEGIKNECSLYHYLETMSSHTWTGSHVRFGHLGIQTPGGLSAGGLPAANFEYRAV